MNILMNILSNVTPVVDFAVVDASTMIALCAQEPGRYAIATTAVNNYAQAGALFYAPNVIVSESQYALCRQFSTGLLTQAEHTQAVQSLNAQMQGVLPPPKGETGLLLRAEQLRDGYGCSRSADSLYIALAEELAQRGQTRLLTFDQGLPNQIARNAPTVIVHLLT